MLKRIVIVGGLALTMMFGAAVSTAVAQPLAPAGGAPTQELAGGPAYDDNVPEVQCSPRNQVRESTGRYVGCRQPAPQMRGGGQQGGGYTQADLPAGAPRGVLIPGYDQSGRPAMIMADTSVVANKFGMDAAVNMANISAEACAELQDTGWRDFWTILRPILKVGAVALAWQDFGATYGILSAVTIGAGEIDQQFYDKDMKAWRKLMKGYCNTLGNYDRKFGKSLQPAARVRAPGEYREQSGYLVQGDSVTYNATSYYHNGH